MPHPALADAEIDRRGQHLYETTLRLQVDTPENRGKHLVMDVETGAYEVDDDGLAASRRLLSRRPGAALYGLRIGYNAVYALGGVVAPSLTNGAPWTKAEVQADLDWAQAQESGV